MLADPTRIRLLHLLQQDAFSVAELAAITRLAQPRVSTHLARLREAGLVLDHRDGVQAFYRLADPLPDELGQLWSVLASASDDPLLSQDQSRVSMVLKARHGDETWAESVAGDMERHYSPGRSWEAAARSMFQLLDLGDVLDMASGDGVLAEAIAPHCRSITCLDVSAKVLEAARRRLDGFGHTRFHEGDMHALPFDDASFDQVLMMHALTYTDQPEQALAEAARVLKPGGELVVATLRAHSHASTVEPYDHVNLGFSSRQLRSLISDTGLELTGDMVTSTERRPPHFTVLSARAGKSAG